MRNETNRRIAHRLYRGLLRVVGSPVRCDVCGKQLGRVFAFTFRGRVFVLGIEESVVRVDFTARNELCFAHLSKRACEEA